VWHVVRDVGRRHDAHERPVVEDRELLDAVIAHLLGRLDDRRAGVDGHHWTRHDLRQPDRRRVAPVDEETDDVRLGEDTHDCTVVDDDDRTDFPFVERPGCVERGAVGVGRLHTLVHHVCDR